MCRTPTAQLLLAAVLAAAPALPGQSVRWDPPGGSLPVGQVSQLQLVFDDCSPNDTPLPPKVDGLRLDYEGQSSNISMINGTFSRSVSVTYAALMSRSQAVEIPAFSVDTNKGRLRVPVARFSPAGATVGSGGISLSDAATASLVPSPESVWAGEVFDLRYTIEVGAGYYPNWLRGTFDWDPSPLIIEDWSQPEPFETGGGEPKTGLAYHTRAVARNVGRIRLNATSQLVNLSVGVTGFGFFQQRQYQQFAVPGGPATIEVRPLPPAPDGFTGAVGDFKLASKVVPVHVKIGDPVTWTVELSGSGNWPEIPGLPAREVPGSFQVIQPKPKRTQPQAKLFEATLSEDVVLVPTQPGTYELPALSFAFFDPKAGAYRAIEAPGGTVIVDPAVAQAAGAQGGAQPGSSAAGPVTALVNPAQARPPEPPAAGLGDPVPPSGTALEPLRRRTLAGACALPFGLLGLLWVALAYRQARRTDPLKPKREARRRIAATLEAMRSAPSIARPPLLLDWQRDTATLWGIMHAAPPAAALGDPQWNALWSEADRCLYSADTILPGDWVGRAHAALAGKTLRPFSAARLLLPRNLVPFMSLALVAALGCRPLWAADPAGAYRAGDFESARDAWDRQVASDPLDWSARHNLSLALAQQDRWGEAAAQAAAAFVQNPSDPATRRQLALACDKAGFAPEPLDALLQSGPVESLARLESPGGWQRAGAAASAVAAVALALLLAAAYSGWRSAWVRAAAFAVLALALLLGGASVAAYRAFGITADTRAVVVWRAGILRSIPTEADVSQKTTSLSAGSTAIADKAFIDWIRLAFPNGQTGWIRRSEAVFLWSTPEK
ncbi:MAG TPA: BatD family protein [Opitutaceae bacterium]|nr:BatD family protein [Opitutaceae bacterium]